MPAHASHCPNNSLYASMVSGKALLGPLQVAVFLAWACSTAAFAQGQPSLAPMLERVLPSVVSINVQASAGADSALEEDGASDPTQTTGSGVIIDAGQGFILTSYHVVANATKITIRLFNVDTYDGELVGSDPQTDLAVVRIKASGLTAMALGDSGALHVGDYVVAIGNPFGLGETATLGIVGALGRGGFGLEGYEDFIQTDASMNPGNSGGALVNLDGELVGINTAIMGPSDTNVGVGFSIPVNIAGGVVKQLITYGEVRRGQLGVAVQDNDRDFERALAIRTSTGALVGEVVPGSPAGRAGVQVADVIVGIDGAPVHTAREFRTKVASYPPGATVTVSVFRREGKFDLRATLASESEPPPAPLPLTMEGDGLLSLVTLQVLDQASDAYGRVEGALVKSMSDRSRASIAGLEAGDVIISVDRKPAKSPQAVLELTRRAKDLLLLGIYRDGHARFIVIR